MSRERKYGVLVFGGAAAGKTSMLTAMWLAAERNFKPAKFTLTPELADVHTLQVARDMLRDVFVSAKEPYYRAVEASVLPEKLRMYLRRQTAAGQPKASPIISLAFVDTPGEFAQKRITSLIEEFTKGVQIGILAVDTVELMRGAGAVHPSLVRNSPLVVRAAVEQWVTSVSGNLLLIVTFLKCETWFRERGSDDQQIDVKLEAAAVQQAFRDRYPEVLDLLSDLKNRVAVVTCPAQTVGNMVFSEYLEPQRSGGYPGEQFTLIQGADSPEQPATGYAPRYCDVPLRHILNFALIAEIEEALARAEEEIQVEWDDLPWAVQLIFGSKAPRWMTRLAKAIEGQFGETADLMKMLSGFVQAVPSGPGFDVLQGDKLVKRNYALWRDLWNPPQ